MTDGVDDVLAVIDDGVDGVPNEISLTRTCEDDDDERDGIDDVVFGSDIVMMVK